MANQYLAVHRTGDWVVTSLLPVASREKAVEYIKEKGNWMIRRNDNDMDIESDMELDSKLKEYRFANRFEACNGWVLYSRRV